MKRGSSLKRKTPLKASGGPRNAKGGLKRSKGLPKANRARRSKLWVRCFLSESFVRFTQGRPCACGCGRSPCEVSHDPSRGAGGTWKSAHPLYHECHAELHAKGSETFWKSRGTTRERVSATHHGAWLEHSVPASEQTEPSA